MESPEGQRRSIEDYLYSQSGEDFSVEHVEKVNSESILGRTYDVWDAHTNEGRWWVITPPTNLYSQEQIKSMDIALSFHIGLMSRMEAHSPVRYREGADRTWVLEVLRRIETASENLDRAKEIEDVQAVGMRLREALLSLIAKMRETGVTILPNETLPEQDGNFKGWAEVFANSIAAGSRLGRLRKLLKSHSDCTWEYLGWLTHARNASHTDGRLALSATNALVELFLFALARAERESEDRCPGCSSYQLEKQMAEPGEGWIVMCSTCGWSRPTDPPGPLPGQRFPEPREEEPVSTDDCVPLEDFGIYITPTQVRETLEAAVRAMEDDDEQPAWANPFAFRFPEEGSVHDVHRLVYSSFKEEPPVGAELTYSCTEANCVNPDHAVASPLIETHDWCPAVVERVTVGQSELELLVSNADGQQQIQVGVEILDRFGLGDASSLVERVVFIGTRGSDGTVPLVPAARRADLSGRTILRASSSEPSDDDVREEPSPADVDQRA